MSDDGFERKVGIVVLGALGVLLVGALVTFNGIGVEPEETIRTLALVVVGVFVGAFGAKKL